MRIELVMSVLLGGGVLWASAAAAGAVRGSPADLETVRGRLFASLAELPEPARHAVLSSADSALRTLRGDGSWADQDYADRSRENWKAAGHLPRVAALATAAMQPAVSPEESSAYIAAAVRALRFWLDADPINANWWHNEIGVPMRIGDILILLGADVPAELRDRGIEVMRRARWEKRMGQNVVWVTKIQIVRACVEGDADAAAEAFGRMYEEVRIAPGKEEGIKPDWSFHQHGELLYSGGYGSGFSRDLSRLAVLAKETAFAIPPEKLEILISYVLEGQAWMVRGHHWDYGVTGRELVRPGKNAWPLYATAVDLASLDPARKRQLLDLAARIRGDADAMPLSGNRDFWCSDYMVHVRPGWFTSARMHSVRTRNTDGFINGENKKSHHLADGVTYIMLKGNEYEDIFPVWDWHKIPGSTVEQATTLDPAQVRRYGTARFVGGVSDGEHGCATMDLNTGSLRAAKSWFYFDEGFVALGAGITCDSDNTVVTTINQCLLSGEVRMSVTAGALEPGARDANDAGWIWHAQVGYVPLSPMALRLRNDRQHGSWREISPGSAAPVTRDVFTLWVDHGPRPADAHYAYLVLPAATASSAENPPVKVLSNTTALQAVHHSKLGMTQAIFREAGSVDCGGIRVSVDRRCALMLKQDGPQIRLTLSNPECEAAEINVTLDGRVQISGAVRLADGRMRLTVMLPEGTSAGRSVTLQGRLASQ